MYSPIGSLRRAFLILPLNAALINLTAHIGQQILADYEQGPSVLYNVFASRVFLTCSRRFVV